MSDGPETRRTMAEADKSFCNLCGILNEKLNNPAWKYIVGGGILRGELPMEPDWQAVDWQPPGRLSIDIGREAKANQQDVAMGLKTRKDIHSSEGRKVEEVWSQKANEERMIMQTAADLAREFGVDDVMAVRNAIASTGQVEEKPPPKEDSPPQKKKLDKDSSKS